MGSVLWRLHRIQGVVLLHHVFWECTTCKQSSVNFFCRRLQSNDQAVKGKPAFSCAPAVTVIDCNQQMRFEAPWVGNGIAITKQFAPHAILPRSTAFTDVPLAVVLRHESVGGSPNNQPAPEGLGCFCVRTQAVVYHDRILRAWKRNVPRSKVRARSSTTAACDWYSQHQKPVQLRPIQHDVTRLPIAARESRGEEDRERTTGRLIEDVESTFGAGRSKMWDGEGIKT